MTASTRTATVGRDAGRNEAPSLPVLRIEMVLPALPFAGMETMVASLARRLCARGHDVGITCTEREGEQAPALRADGIAVTLVPTPGLWTNLRAPRLTAHLARRAPDVLHAHSGTWAKAARAARHAGIPRVVFTGHGLHEDGAWHHDWVMRWAARSTDMVVAVSEDLRAHFSRTLRVPPNRLTTLINGVDTDRFRPGARGRTLRDRLDLDESAPVIGTVARLSPVKNQVLLIDAFHRLRQTVPVAQLVFAGEGPLRAELGNRAEALGIADAVHFIGVVADPAPLYRELDVFVLPSRSEGTSISLLESMASGTPVVASAVGGSSALLGDGTRGLLVPSNDAGALAVAMESVLHDRAAAEERAAAALRHVVERFSADAMAAAYERLYLPGDN
jgi:glycosyltransferase involved in cell wall biosynthesis